MRWPLGRVEVVGDSMLPTLRAGDWWVVAWAGRRARPGDVVVARRPDRPDLLIVKRIVGGSRSGWWLEGDNPSRSDDSRLFGAVPDDHVMGRLLLRYRRGRAGA